MSSTEITLEQLKNGLRAGSAVKTIVRERANDTTRAWNEMMLNASLKRIAVYEYVVGECINGIDDSRETKKHYRKLMDHKERVQKYYSTPLYSGTYINEVLKPLKSDFESFEAFARTGLANVFPGGEDTINSIFEIAKIKGETRDLTDEELAHKKAKEKTTVVKKKGETKFTATKVGGVEVKAA